MSPADTALGEDAADAAGALDLMLADAALPFVALLRQETLLLFGANDPIIPVVNGRIFHRFLPHSTLVVYDGGHLVVVLRAPQVVPHINGSCSTSRPHRPPLSSRAHRHPDSPKESP